MVLTICCLLLGGTVHHHGFDHSKLPPLPDRVARFRWRILLIPL
jgi:hypothetical protein